MASVKVAVLGATGRTGQTIITGLQESTETKFDIIALIRPSSLANPSTQALRDQGVRIVTADLVAGSHQDLVEALGGVDVVISAIVWHRLGDEAALARAAKDAGVGRFVPCFWGPPSPRGVHMFNDMKLDSLAEIQRLHLPYTVIDVGWWTQQMVPDLPSGRTRHAAFEGMLAIPGTGDAPVALTDYRDIGRYAARVLTDPRTLNRLVLAYTEIMTFNGFMSLVERLSGEKVALPYRSGEDLKRDIASAKSALAAKPGDWQATLGLVVAQYLDLLGVRGDSDPERARYLGYLDFKDLYPDVRGRTAEDMLVDVLAGKPSGYVRPAGYSITADPGVKT
ncbi:hypothetical protein N3K66_008216 [Trichothecium roseum]|uniref:Uncharacterized protein n=1 Tax=Trichothecium roseum TaxID=47278 RepID=A0ACC0UUL4_9HYPO|nr:hypothetical protein N3K66_008216 [Trichothecium roseum]